jgi:hypothetical protein
LKKKEDNIPWAALFAIKNIVALEWPSRISKLLGPGTFETTLLNMFIVWASDKRNLYDAGEKLKSIKELFHQQVSHLYVINHQQLNYLIKKLVYMNPLKLCL